MTISTPRARRTLALAGAGLLWASAGIHLDLYATGYRRIPTIGNLFLLQAGASVAIGFAVMVTAHSAAARRSAALFTSFCGAAFALGTAISYSVSRAVGMFGFHELPSSAGVTAGLLEVGAFATLGALLVVTRRASPAQERPLGEQAAPTRRGAIRAAVVGRSASRALVGTTAAVAIAMSATVVTLGLGHSGPPAAASAKPSGRLAAPGMVRVHIAGFAFVPHHVRARPGEVVAVTNDDHVTHTMTAVPDASPAGHFSTGNVAPGRTVHFRAPMRPGTYAFYCSIHPFMTGVLIVAR